MKRCAKCGAYSQDGYVVCSACGADLGGPEGGGSVYGRGLIGLLSSRIGIRLVMMVLGAVFLLGWFGYYALTH
jgi:hypothetical protein